jgi:Histidine kinase-like ATPase domain
MTSARQLPEPDSASWSWITAAARAARSPGSPASPAGFPRTATWPVAHEGGLRPVAGVRASARAMLQRWGITERGDDIVLVLSELLANALLHARPGPGRWRVAAGLLQPCPAQGVLCAVTDPGPDWPRPRPGGRLGESGRGLQVIGELSELRGYVPGPAGKIAWALLGDVPALPQRRRQPNPARRRRPVTDPVLLARVLHGLHAL